MLVQALTFISHHLFFGLAALGGIGFVIAFHELGHFLFCKLFNVSTPSFSIGFGPRLITKKIGTTEFAISAIPLGGYVEIAGASEVGQGEQKEAYRTDSLSFSQKPWYQKFLIMIGGILFNIIFAYSACSLLFMIGMPESMILYPRNTKPVVAAVREASAAQKAGLVKNDRILAINALPVDQNSAANLIEGIMAMPNKNINLLIERNNQHIEVDLTIDSRNWHGKNVGSAGLIFETGPLPAYGFLESIQEGVKLANHLIYQSAQGIRHIFSTGDTSNIASPVMLISETAKGAEKGFKTLILFLAYISLGLAVLNLLPLPILDGGQILFYTVEAIIGRPLPEKIREYIHIACWLLFIVLTVFICYRDLKNLLYPHVDYLLGLIKR